MPAHDKTYDKTCATSKDSDQPVHLRNLIRVFTGHMCLLLPPGYPKGDEREPLPYWWMYRLILVFAGHTGLIIAFCRLLAPMNMCCLYNRDIGPDKRGIQINIFFYFSMKTYVMGHRY